MAHTALFRVDQRQSTATACAVRTLRMPSATRRVGVFQSIRTAEIEAINFAIEAIEDPLSDGAGLPPTFFIEHGDFGFIADPGEVQLQFVLITVTPKLEFREEPTVGDFAFAGRYANEKDAVFFIGLIDIVAGAFQRNARAAPGTGEILQHGQLHFALTGADNLRATRIVRLGCGAVVRGMRTHRFVTCARRVGGGGGGPGSFTAGATQAVLYFRD